MKVIWKLLLTVACLSSLHAAASSVSFNQIPSGWRVQDYVSTSSSPSNEVVAAYYTYSSTQSSCASGVLLFPSTATAGDRNRFYVTIMNAKNTASQVFVVYESTTCVMTSYGILEQ